MAVKLNQTAFDYAKELIVAGKFIFDERDAWSEHQPSAAAGKRIHRTAWVRRLREMAFGD